MNGCQHCTQLAAETAAIRQLVLQQATTLAVTQQIVRDLKTTLITGNGQPGKCHQHDTQFKLHEDALTEIREWKCGIDGAVKAMKWVLGIFVTITTGLSAAVLSRLKVP